MVLGGHIVTGTQELEAMADPPLCHCSKLLTLRWLSPSAPGKGISNMEESVTLDNGGFAALELNSRHLNVKSTFSKKNGTR